LSEPNEAPLGNESLPWLNAQKIPIAGAEMPALRLSYAGELGRELHLPEQHTVRVFDAICSEGQDHGIANYGSFAMNAMRMEKMFKGASELTNEATLPEAGAMRFLRLDKAGAFLGDAATRRSAEPNRRPWQSVDLEVDAEGVDCLDGEAIFAAGDRRGSSPRRCTIPKSERPRAGS